MYLLVSDLSRPVSVSLTTDSSSAGTSTRPTRNRRVRAIGKQRVTNDLVADLKGQVAEETFVEKKRSSRECSKCGEKFKLFSTLKRHLIESTKCSRERRKRRRRIEMKGIFHQIITLDLLKEMKKYVRRKVHCKIHLLNINSEKISVAIPCQLNFLQQWP